MRTVTVDLTNEETKALRRELERFKADHLVPRMTGTEKDPADTATPAYIAADRLLRLLQPQGKN